MNLKKFLRKEYTYLDKTCNNHDYKENYILEITNDNVHASGNYYGKKEYYEVLKCSYCNSFIPKSSEGNYSGHIFNYQNTNLPIIHAKTNQKNPAYLFDKLYDVKIDNK